MLLLLTISLDFIFLNLAQGVKAKSEGGKKWQKCKKANSKSKHNGTGTGRGDTRESHLRRKGQIKKKIKKAIKMQSDPNTRHSHADRRAGSSSNRTTLLLSRVKHFPFVVLTSTARTTSPPSTFVMTPIRQSPRRHWSSTRRTTSSIFNSSSARRHFGRACKAET